MMKKSLSCLALASALATTSMAADVTVYGKVDLGLMYRNVEVTDFNGMSKTTEDNLTLDSGVGQTSRFGIKATEKLDNGYNVSFKLENGFNADDGTYKGAKDNRLFDREATLTVAGDFGQLSAGRVGGMGFLSGSYNLVYSRADAFGGGNHVMGGKAAVLGFAKTTRYDNMLTYQTPKWNGLQATAQYSLKTDSTDDTAEGHDDAERYAAFGATYDAGPLRTVVTYEQIIQGDSSKNADGKIVYFGGQYRFDAFRLYAMGQVYEGMSKTGWSKPKAIKLNADGIDGYSIHLGTRFNAFAGEFTFGGYYGAATANRNGKADIDGDYIGAIGRYIYKLSKRTNLRTSLSYDRACWDSEELGSNDWEQERYVGTISLVHNF